MSDQLSHLLSAATELGASDLHLIVGVPPAFRINGEIIFADADYLPGTQSRRWLIPSLVKTSAKPLNASGNYVFPCPQRRGAHSGHLYRRNTHPEMSIRFCGDRIRDREELGLPAKIDDLARRASGLVLITGPTGSGKTTTLNYMVDLINRERRCKIITIEDPIEYVHENKRAIVVQQEVLTDTHSFNRALIHVLRQTRT